MFSLFKPNPLKKLQKQYHHKLEQAMLAQRKGDIRSYAFLTVEANEILKDIQQMEANQTDV